MREQSASSERDRDRDERLSESPQVFRVIDQIGRLRTDSSYLETGKSSIILARKGHLRVVLTTLAQGREMEPHHTGGPFTLQVVEGSIQVDWGDSESTLLREQDLLTFPGQVEHSIVATEDTAFLIVLDQPTEPTVEIPH